MVYNLKPIDAKILAYLYQDSRAPATKIAKALHISREQVSYKIKKFESDGIIKGYIPLPSYTRLGYPNLVLVFFKFNKQNNIKEFKQKLKNSKNRITTVETLAHYDLGVLFIFHSEKERNEYIANLIQEANETISDYIMLEPYFSEFYPLKFLNSTHQSKIFHEYKKEEYKLDEKEKKILSVMNKNANLPVIGISKATSISAELIVYKLKRLKEEQVLLGTRAYFDMEKTGYFYSIVLVNFRNFSKANQEKLRHFAKESGSIDSLMMLLGKPNCYMQLFYKSEKELRATLQKFKEVFKEESFDLNILPLKNEGEDINALPFI